MPSGLEFVLRDVHHIVEQLWVLEVESLIVHSDYNHVVPPVVEFSVGTRIVWGLENLQ